VHQTQDGSLVASVCFAHCLPTRLPCVLLCGITALRGRLVFAVGESLSGLRNLYYRFEPHLCTDPFTRRPARGVLR
jgi:hypothetical protein